MDKRFTLILLGLFVAFGGIFWFSKQGNNTDGPASSNSVQATKHTVGAGKKGVTLVEYGDLECPACGQYFPILQEVKKKYGDDITFQYRHFPLPSHPQARIAHRAAEAAGKQGKFFEMHDMMYQRQQEWSGNNSAAKIFEGYATEIGLDVEKFKTDAASVEINAIINADVAEGQKIGAASTPTFVINDKLVERNPRSLDEFVKLIDDAINAKSGQQ